MAQPHTATAKAFQQHPTWSKLIPKLILSASEAAIKPWVQVALPCKEVYIYITHGWHPYSHPWGLALPITFPSHNPKNEVKRILLPSAYDHLLSSSRRSSLIHLDVDEQISHSPTLIPSKHVRAAICQRDKSF